MNRVKQLCRTACVCGGVLFLLLVVSTPLLRAQTIALNPYFSQEGLDLAGKTANTDLPEDAVLVLIGSPGHETTRQGDFEVTLEFDMETGRANAWGYVFYVPSQSRHRVLTVVDIPVVGQDGFEVFPVLPVPAELTDEVNTSLPYADSDAMLAELKENEVYADYRSDLPDVVPVSVAYQTFLQTDWERLPDGFPAEGGGWVMSFQGGGDTAMTCWVSGETGLSYCLRGEPSSSVSLTDASNAVSVDVSRPFGRNGLRLDVVGVAPNETIDAALFNVMGELTATPVQVIRSGDGVMLEADLSNLPVGTYYCRIAGNGWTRTVQVSR